MSLLPKNGLGGARPITPPTSLPAPRRPSTNEPTWWIEHHDELLARSASLADAPGFVALVDALDGDRARAVATLAMRLGDARQVHTFQRTVCPCCSLALAITDDARALCVRPDGCTSEHVVAAISTRAQAEADRLVKAKAQNTERAAAEERRRDAERTRIAAEQARERDAATCSLDALPTPAGAQPEDLIGALGELDTIEDTDGMPRGLGMCPGCSSPLVSTTRFSFDEVTVDARCLGEPRCTSIAIVEALATRIATCTKERIHDEQAQAVLRAAKEAEAQRRAAEADRAATLARYSLDHLSTVEAPTWKLDGWIPDRALTLLTGDGGSRKTWTLIEWALCMASGLPWLGHAVKRSRVYLMLLESGDTDHGERLRLCAAGLGIDLASLREWLFVAPRGTELRLDDHASVADLLHAVDALDPGVLAIDNLAKSTPGIDEDSNAKMTAAMRPLEAIAKDRAVVLLHHTAKTTGTSRGASAIRNNVDHELKIAAASDANNATITLSTGKARLGGSPPVRFHVVGDRRRQEPIRFETVATAPKEARSASTDKRARMIAFLSEPRTKDDTYDHVGGRRADAVKLLSTLIDERAVIEIEPGRWRIASTDEE